MVSRMPAQARGFDLRAAEAPLADAAYVGWALPHQLVRLSLKQS